MIGRIRRMIRRTLLRIMLESRHGDLREGAELDLRVVTN